MIERFIIAWVSQNNCIQDKTKNLQKRTFPFAGPPFPILLATSPFHLRGWRGKSRLSTPFFASPLRIQLQSVFLMTLSSLSILSFPLGLEVDTSICCSGGGGWREKRRRERRGNFLNGSGEGNRKLSTPMTFSAGF